MSNPTVFGGLIRAGSGAKLPDKNKTGLEGLAALGGNAPAAQWQSLFGAKLAERRLPPWKREGWTPGGSR